MAYWETQSVIILRGLINDMGPTFTYEDPRLIDILLISAQLIKRECDFDTVYTISIEGGTISPDPGSPLDEAFINLTCLKAASLMLFGEVKLLAAGSFEIKDGTASISSRGAYSATKELYDKICDDYAMAKLEYKAGNLGAIKAILTPYTVNSSYYNDCGNVVFG